MAALVSPAGHYGLNDLRRDLDGILSTAQTLGQRGVVVPSLDAADRLFEAQQWLGPAQPGLPEAFEVDHFAHGSSLDRGSDI